MLPFKLVYSDGYFLPIGSHVFPAEKYRCVHKELIRNGIAEKDDFVAPAAASDSDVLLVHTPLYVEKLKKGLLSSREELELEVPYSPELVKAFWLMAGGSMLAADLALQDNICVNIGGGFHHAFPDHGEGFCMLHDVGIAIRKMQQTGKIARAMVIDCDVHQGNGTAFIFGNGESEPFPKPAWSAPQMQQSHPAAMKTNTARDVFTISLHQENNYPAWKPRSSIDVNLPDGTTDEEYLKWLNVALQTASEQFSNSELICYVAGADPYVDDQLGGLAMSMEGLRKRDEVVLEYARASGVPVMVSFAGGYATRIDDTVAIHTNTVLAARHVFS